MSLEEFAVFINAMGSVRLTRAGHEIRYEMQILSKDAFLINVRHFEPLSSGSLGVMGYGTYKIESGNVKEVFTKTTTYNEFQYPNPTSYVVVVSFRQRQTSDFYTKELGTVSSSYADVGIDLPSEYHQQVFKDFLQSWISSRMWQVSSD